LRVLIAEDHPDIAALMTRLVVHAGHEASLAADGYAAIRLAAELAPQLVLLDINMPGIDGYETARRLRKQFANRFPIFAVTAAQMDLPLAVESGFDGIFSKPFDVAKLIALLAQLPQVS
jgi:two-component system, cell cycle response regulator DivK